MTLLTVDDIAELLKLSRDYVRDRLVKSAEFPRPAIVLSQKNRRWEKSDVESWVSKSKQSLAR